MFYNCYSFTSLNISNFNTKKILDIDNFDTPKLTDITSMFQSYTNMLELYLPIFNARNCRKYINSFEGCYNLTLKIDGENFILRNYVPKYVDTIDITD